MKFKTGVNPSGLRAGLTQPWPKGSGRKSALDIIDEVHRELTGQEATVTSTTEGKHSVKRSAHYRGDAVDLRVWHVPTMLEYADKLEAALGDDFYVQPEYRIGTIEDGKDIPYGDQSIFVKRNVRIDEETNEEIDLGSAVYKIPSHVHVHWSPIYQEERDPLYDGRS